MTDVKATDAKTAEQKAADQQAKTTPTLPATRSDTGSKDLAPAGESGDPTIQKLLADRQAHVSNAGLEPDPEADAIRKANEDAIAEIDEKLADLGFSAK